MLCVHEDETAVVVDLRRKRTVPREDAPTEAPPNAAAEPTLLLPTAAGALRVHRHELEEASATEEVRYVRDGIGADVQAARCGPRLEV